MSDAAAGTRPDVPRVSLIGRHRLLLEALAAWLSANGVPATWCSPETLDGRASDVWIVEETGDDGRLLGTVRERAPAIWYVLDFHRPRSDAPPDGASGRISVDATIRDVADLLRCPAEPASRPIATSPSLSPREVQVLGAMAAGATQQAIADALCVSTETVRTHLQNAMAKLGAHSRREAVAIASDRGWLQPKSGRDQA
jgi:DNA-binding CsgD family transcriptional regulator